MAARTRRAAVARTRRAATIEAQIADLKTREDALKAELIARGNTEAEGSLFSAVISTAMRWTSIASA